MSFFLVLTHYEAKGAWYAAEAYDKVFTAPKIRSRGPFLENPVNSSGPQSHFQLIG